MNHFRMRSGKGVSVHAAIILFTKYREDDVISCKVYARFHSSVNFSNSPFEKVLS